MKLTKWYQSTQKPVRIGLYQTTIFEIPNPPIIIMAYWDGEKWWHITKTFKKFKNEPLFFQDVYWRGVKK